MRNVDWPLQLPDAMGDGLISLRRYRADDADALFLALSDEAAWEYIPRAIPRDSGTLDDMIQSKLSDGLRNTYVIRRDEQAAGMTSVLFDPQDPDGVEVGGTQVGGTQIDPHLWGTGVNERSKQLLFAAIFALGAEWIQLRTDERNGRSAAAIRKLGARDLGLRPDHRVRRDGTKRSSLMFRIDRPLIS